MPNLESLSLSVKEFWQNFRMACTRLTEMSFTLRSHSFPLPILNSVFITEGLIMWIILEVFFS